MNPSLKLPSIPLWDAHWPTQKLLEEQDTNPRSFQRGFRQSAFTDEERMFPHFQDCFTPGIVVGEIIRRAWPTFAGVDLAGDKRPGNVIFVAAVDPTTERRYPVEVLRGNWKSPEMASKLAGVRERHPNLRVIMVENNGYQQSLVDWIKQTPGDNSYWYMVESYTTGFASKVNPIYGLPGLDIEFKNKAWVIPSSEFEGHPPHCVCGWCVWKEEVKDYPMGAQCDTVMACVPPGAVVTTLRGLVPIEQVVEGDYVLTHRSRFRRVNGTTSRRYDGDTVVLKPFGRRPLVVTPEHPVWAAGGRFDTASGTNRLIPSIWSFKEAEALKAGPLRSGDFVFAPAPQNTSALPELDLASYIPTPSARGVHWRVEETRMSFRSRSMPRRVRLNDEVATLIGLFIAEGSVGRHGTLTSFAFHKREKHLQDFVERVAQEAFGTKSTVITATGHGGMNVCPQSAVMGRLFSTFGKRDHKAVPWEWWWSWPNETRLRVVRGWLLGDGHARRLPKGKSSLSAVSISWPWLYQAQLALVAAGLAPVFSEFKQPGEYRGRPCRNHNAWRMLLSESDSAKLLSLPLSVEETHWTGKVMVQRDRTNSTGHPCDGGIAIKLRKVSREPYSGLVFNLHVDEDESFVVEGLAVHNCFFCREAISKWGTGANMGVGGTGGVQGINDR